MKAWWGFILAPAALLLGSASPPVPLPQLAIDPSVFEESACPAGAGEDCMLFAGASGEIVLAGLPRAAAVTAASAPSRVPAAAPRGFATPRPRSSGAPVRVVVSLPQQKAYVFRKGRLVATAPVSTGKRGHPTPLGTFRILQKKVHHKSNRYANAPMPYMQRLTHYGIALHAGHLPGYPASHGCIRLPWSFARKLYGMTDGDTRVTITRDPVKLAAA